MPDISKRLEKAKKYVEKGKIDNALTEYLFAFKEDPSNDGLVEIIAELYLRQNQPDKALECYSYLSDKYVERNDGPAAVLIFRKMARLGVQEPGRMLICARFQEKQKPAEARDIYRLCAQMFLERGDKPRALEALRGLAGLEQSSPEAHVRVAELAEGLGEKELAVQEFVRAGELLRAGHSRDRAMAMLERAHALAPGDAHVCTVLATIAFESGNPARTAELLEPHAAQIVPERHRLLAEAHLATGNLARAEELFWVLAPKFPETHADLMRVLEGYLAARNTEAAVNLLRKLKQALFSAGKNEEFLGWVEGLQGKSLAGVEVLEFLASLYSDMNRESMVAGTIARLFDVAIEAGQYAEAAQALERLAQLNPNEPENKNRLERLTGKLDDRSYQVLASRILRTAAPAAAMDGGMFPELAGAPAGGAAPGGSLEEMVLQAELLLQFGSKDEATEYLRGIARQFPGEESRNERLLALFVETGLAAKPAAAAITKTAAMAAVTAAAAAVGAEPEAEEAMPEIARVSEITRNIYRQGAVKGVLSTCVNEVGKTWQVSRCVVGLCTPGKPPTAVLEYCSPGVRQSEVQSVVKLVTTLVQLTVDGNPLALEDAAASGKLSEVAPVVQSLAIQSLLALPLMDADQAAGVVVLEQCDRSRRWRTNEIFILKTIVDQMATAMSNVKLRSLMKAVADERSGLLNRGSYLDCLLSEAAHAQKQNTPLSVALMQFGREQQTVRQLGEDTIQQFMQEAAQAVISHLRQNDVGVRYDAITVAIILPDTKAKDTLTVVDKVRRVVSNIKIGPLEGLPLTAGIAEALQPGKMDPADSVTELINRVEAALEAAWKEAGTSKLLMSPVGAAAS